MHVVAQPGDSTPRSSHSRVREAAILVICLLIALVSLGYWVYVTDKESNDQEARLQDERKKTETLTNRVADTDQKLAVLNNDLSMMAQRLAMSLGELARSQSYSVLLKKDHGASTSGAEGSNHRNFSDPVWNVWTEPTSSEGILYAPQKLQPGRDYSLVINLAALSFDQDKSVKDAGLYSQQADSSFMNWVDKNTQLPSRDIQLLVIPDRVYFERQLDGQVMQPFTVELAKMRQIHANGFSLPGSALKYLQTHGSVADFSFGIKSFHIKTSSQLGLGSIAISVWADGMPVNEISYSVCIVHELTDACDYPAHPTYTLKGVDLSKLDRPPDAALQIIDRQSDVVGVFRCNSCGWANDDFRIWKVAETEKDFAGEIKKIVSRLGKVPKLLSQSEYGLRFQAASDALYNVLFGVPDSSSPQDENQEQAKNALSAFNGFVSKSRSLVLAGSPPLSLFVRLIPSEPDLVLTPVALMEVKLPQPPVPASLSPSKYPNFAGFYVDIQAPLEFQDYSRSSSCLSQWVLFVPPPQAPDGGDYQDVEDARVPFQDWINTFQESCGDCVKQDSSLNGFRTWLRGSGAPADAIVTLSHHDDTYGLYFDGLAQDPSIITSDINRTFDRPAVAILAACGTAEPGGADFISKFNSRKVYTIMATTSAVDAGMAGKFLSLLMDNLKQHRTNSAYTLSQARFDAVRALSHEEDAPSSHITYGARALAFILAGNGSIRLCPPADAQSTGDVH